MAVSNEEYIIELSIKKVAPPKLEQLSNSFTINNSYFSEVLDELDFNDSVSENTKSYSTVIRKS